MTSCMNDDYLPQILQIEQMIKLKICAISEKPNNKITFRTIGG